MSFYLFMKLTIALCSSYSMPNEMKADCITAQTNCYQQNYQGTEQSVSVCFKKSAKAR